MLGCVVDACRSNVMPQEVLHFVYQILSFLHNRQCRCGNGIKHPAVIGPKVFLMSSVSGIEGLFILAAKHPRRNVPSECVELCRLFCMEGPQSDETQKVQLLRARLEEFSPQSKDIDDGTLRRFLRARSLNVDKALKFLLQHLKWCETFKPLGFIPETEIVNELKKEKIFVQGTDKTGRPIGVILATRHITSERNLEEFKRFVVYGFDKAVASLQGDQEKFVLIADLKGYGYKNMDVKGYLSILEILQDHFPERLGKFYILHVPSLFWVAWKVVYPFIDPNVRDKIVFVDDKQITETLLKDIDITQLPDEFGGQRPLIPIQHVGNSAKSST